MSEGRVRNASGTLTNEYMIKDQQGNVRVSFENNAGTALVRQENSYYPFGLTMPGSVTPTAANKNLYNGGSEWQDDFGNLPDLQQTFYRNYDAALGRFIGVDPVAEAAESMSTYHYAANNPVMFNDPLGDQTGGYEEVQPVFHGGYKRIGAGSGNWSDGMKYSDWNLYDGSETYRAAMRAGAYHVNGSQYLLMNGTRMELAFQNGVAGYYAPLGATYTGKHYAYYSEYKAFLEGPVYNIGKPVWMPFGSSNNGVDWSDLGRNYVNKFLTLPVSHTSTFSSGDYTFFEVSSPYFDYAKLSGSITRTVGTKKMLDVNYTLDNGVITKKKLSLRDGFGITSISINNEANISMSAKIGANTYAFGINPQAIMTFTYTQNLGNGLDVNTAFSFRPGAVALATIAKAAVVFFSAGTLAPLLAVP